MTTVITPNPGKSHVEVPAVQVPIDHGHNQLFNDYLINFKFHKPLTSNEVEQVSTAH